MNFSYYWPILLIVLANVAYHICTKSVPEAIDPMASLIVTYLVGAVTATIMYFALNHGGHLLREFTHLNWSPFVLGLAIVGLEVGSIYMYKAGWNVNTGYMTHSAILSVVLLVLGLLLYNEAITWSKALGTVICLVGLYVLNL